MDFLENEELQKRVDYSFGDQSGVYGGVPNAYIKTTDIGKNSGEDSVVKFIDFLNGNTKKVVTLFIDNIRLYNRPIMYSDWLHVKPISEKDREWLKQFEYDGLLELCAMFYNRKFIIFTAFEDTPLDEWIYDKIPDNVISINAANGVIFGGKVKPFPHGIERKMYEGYNHHELLEQAMASSVEPSKALLVCHRDDTGARGKLKDLFRYKSWATTSLKLDYEPYLKAIQNHKFVLCPSGNGIESARNWETLYLRRVPVFKDHPYLREMFRDFPTLFVKDFEEVTEQLLLDHEYLYQQAQIMDMKKLSLSYWFNKAINESI